MCSGKIMPNSCEGHRDCCTLLTLEGAPGQAGRRPESCVLGAAESTQARRHRGSQGGWGGASKAGENKASQESKPRGTACPKDSGAYGRVIQPGTEARSGRARHSSRSMENRGALCDQQEARTPPQTCSLWTVSHPGPACRPLPTPRPWPLESVPSITRTFLSGTFLLLESKTQRTPANKTPTDRDYPSEL